MKVNIVFLFAIIGVVVGVYGNRIRRDSPDDDEEEEWTEVQVDAVSDAAITEETDVAQPRLYSEEEMKAVEDQCNTDLETQRHNLDSECATKIMIITEDYKDKATALDEQHKQDMDQVNSQLANQQQKYDNCLKLADSVKLDNEKRLGELAFNLSQQMTLTETCRRTAETQKNQYEVTLAQLKNQIQKEEDRYVNTNMQILSMLDLYRECLTQNTISSMYQEFVRSFEDELIRCSSENLCKSVLAKFTSLKRAFEQRALQVTSSAKNDSQISPVDVTVSPLASSQNQGGDKKDREEDKKKKEQRNEQRSQETEREQKKKEAEKRQQEQRREEEEREKEKKRKNKH